LFTADDILADPGIRPVGIQTVPDDSTSGGIIFVHERPTCMTSFLVPFNVLDRILAQPAAQAPIFVRPRCDHRCEATYNNVPCSLSCAYVPYHHLLLRLLKRREGAAFATYC